MTPYLIDKAAILERLGGDEDIFVMMLDIFLQDVGNNIEALLAAWQSGDMSRIHREAHTVKGLFATVSDNEAAALALALERQSGQGACPDGEATVDLLVNRLREVSAALNRELGR